MSKYTDFTVKNYEKIIRNLEKIQRHVKYMSKIEKYVKKDLVGGAKVVVDKFAKGPSPSVQLYQIKKVPEDAINMTADVELQKVTDGSVNDPVLDPTVIKVKQGDLMDDEIWIEVGKKAFGPALGASKAAAGLPTEDEARVAVGVTSTAGEGADITRQSLGPAPEGANPAAAADADISTEQPAVTTQPLGSAAEGANPAAEEVPLEQAEQAEQSEVKANETLYKDGEKMYLVKASIVEYNTDPKKDTEQWVVMDLDTKKRVKELKSTEDILTKSKLNDQEKETKKSDIEELQLSSYVETPEDRAIKTGITVVKLDLEAITDIGDKIDQLLEIAKNAGQREIALSDEIANLKRILTQKEEELAQIKIELESLRTTASSGASPEEKEKLETLEEEKKQLEGYIADLTIQLQSANENARTAQTKFAELAGKLERP